MGKMIGAAEFKAKCLAILDEVQRTGEPVTITKRGKPVAEVKAVVPAERPSLIGFMKGKLKILGDIETPLDPDWEEEWEANNPPEMYR
ncbi:MAG: type II toxin-antitoxin system prevent-host-death family antitoxin [Alphaproteobacteria bacterium]|nr:type II toxin-antitoxin system prevent-host-death family antitoxin [Alphaproteobacteria bacterium]MBV9371823.1 type II toxin-antitoxin system prevent-host-death family antitoxin [Alphaproteobacteria bacterium]MBV9900382.1 type II toxin-antitoxin system prevent-host-death family antitoxin [Alphaproteobacteria bacterium]